LDKTVKRFIIAAIAAFAFLIIRWEFSGKLNLSSGGTPVIADVDNGDGTVDYALIPNHRGKRHEVWILRLPKSLKVHRAGTEGMSGSGGGAGFETAPTSNDTITVYVKWPSLEDGYAPTKPARSSVLADRSVIRLSITPSQIGSTDSFERSASHPACRWKSTDVPKIFEFLGSTDPMGCSDISQSKLFKSLGLIEGGKLLAEFFCEDTPTNKACRFHFYARNRNIYGDVALELLPQFSEIRKAVINYLEEATVEDKVY
jgi:hypothetical protein